MLSARHLHVDFGGTTALDGVSLDVADGEVTAVLGPSGSGKTTLLRVVAGLQQAGSGVVRWDDTDLSAVPAHRRGFGMVFQDFALFPHLDVAANVAFGLRMQGITRAKRDEMVSDALDGVDLTGFETRRIGTLSGGQAQRVALARALAPRPRMLLFDEPLGSLDRALREHLVEEIREVLTRRGITALYVTHDQSEAFAVAGRIAVLDRGRLLQAGTPEEVWRTPASEQVARFLGFRPILEGRVEAGTADTAVGVIPVPAGTPDGPVRLVIRPDALRLADHGPVTGIVRADRFRGADTVVDVEAGGLILQVTCRIAPPAGATAAIAVDPDGVVILGTEP